MVVQIGAKPDSGFDDPIGMLQDCHRRIERFVGVLSQVVERAPSRPLTEDEAGAIQRVLQYFRSGGRRHNADEEESVFPRLMGAIPADGKEAIERLEKDHREADELHEVIDRLYTEWIAKGSLSAEDRAVLLEKTGLLQRMYDEHIPTEEKVVFPHASRLLDQSTLTTIGQEFKARRDNK